MPPPYYKYVRREGLRIIIGVDFTQVTIEESHIYLLTSKFKFARAIMTASSSRNGGAQGPTPLAEEVVPKVTLRICGLQFLVQIAPLLSRTELETLTPLLALASVSTPKSIVDRFILKNAVVITND